MNHSFTEENYIKAIYQLTISKSSASTNDIAKSLETKASSVTDMLKKLKEKKLVNYEKYKGVKLTKPGIKLALMLIRKHRLWETFLVEKLNFDWHEIHEMAEELEHINSDELILRLDSFLEYPRFILMEIRFQTLILISKRKKTIKGFLILLLEVKFKLLEFQIRQMIFFNI